MSAPSALTPSQLSQFLTHISLPASSDCPEPNLSLLTALHIHTISTVPYENLHIHYSASHTPLIAPLANYKATVEHSRGRGGYCFQLAILFNHVLRGLGFSTSLAAVRIRNRVDGVPTGAYRGWSHVVNIVTLADGSKYSLDVAFGGDGPTAPMRLVEDEPQLNLGTQEVRFVRDWMPGQVRRTEEGRSWVYQYRNSAEKAWNSFYAFSETEALEADFEHLNWWTGSHPTSFQTFTCIVVKFLRRPKARGSKNLTELNGAEGEQAQEFEIYGKRMLVNGTVKENLGGKTRMVQECTTEAERVEALERWFGITLSEEETQAIKGWGTELREKRRSDGVVEDWAIRRGPQGAITFCGSATS